MPATDRETSRSVPAAARPFARTVAVFVAAVLALHLLWGQARGSALERAVIDGATVHAAVALIAHLTPAAGAVAEGSRIRAAGGGINILNGCEGTEVAFLFIAAALAGPLTWRVRLLGLCAGLPVIFALNQLRLLALFYSYRSDRALFEQLHGLVAPLFLVAATLGLFVLLLRWQRGRPAAGGSAA